MLDELLLDEIEAALEDWLSNEAKKPNGPGVLQKVEEDIRRRKRLAAALAKVGFLRARSRAPPTIIPCDPDARLSRKQTAAALTAAGFTNKSLI
jgi:hypothetical protein